MHKPLLSLGLRLGEGTGALCAYPIIDSAVRMINEMNNFDNAHITKYFYDRIWAAFIFFTRLPFWRLHQPPQECYKTVVEHWPLRDGSREWLWLPLLYGVTLVPYEIAIILAIIVRLLITGALHEDGLADFFDGFGGGGHDRQRILAIMKDSHIGTYGVIGLIVYFLLLFHVLHSMQPADAALAIIAADPFAKMLSAQLILMMPYARTEETAKTPFSPSPQFPLFFRVGPCSPPRCLSLLSLRPPSWRSVGVCPAPPPFFEYF